MPGHMVGAPNPRADRKGPKHGPGSDEEESAIAVPTCIAVAIASGFPPIVGFLTALVGAFVTAIFSSCRFQVSGAAASMIAITWLVIDKQGVEVYGLIVLVAGIYQIAGSLLKCGRWFSAISPSLIYGMMTGIGFLIGSGQLLVVLGQSSRGNGISNVLVIPSALQKVFAGDRAGVASLLIGLLTVALLFVWNKIPIKRIRSSLDLDIFVAALPIAFLASINSLLAATIIDQLREGKGTDYNRELLAQGIGNLCCGFIGCLPAEGAASKGVANVEAGARSRMAAVLPGLWIILLLSFLPQVLAAIPLVALAGILVHVGFRLAKHGKSVVGIYLVTSLTIISVDVLTGIGVGFLLALIKIVYTFSSDIEITVGPVDDGSRVAFKGAATFLALPQLNDLAESQPPEGNIHIDVEGLYHIDFACVDFLTKWEMSAVRDSWHADVSHRCLCYLWQRENHAINTPPLPAVGRLQRCQDNPRSPNRETRPEDRAEQ